MKDKMFLFPALILVLTPCVWYSNQPGVDGIQGIDFLLSPGCFLATAIAVIGCLLRKEAICLIGNLLFIPAMLPFFCRGPIKFLPHSYQSNLYFPPHLLKKPSKTTVPIVEILLFTTII